MHVFLDRFFFVCFHSGAKERDSIVVFTMAHKKKHEMKKRRERVDS